MSLLYINGFDQYTNTTTKLPVLSPSRFIDGAQTAVTGNNETATMPVLGGRGAQWDIRTFSGLGTCGSGGIKMPFTAASGMTVGIGFHVYFAALPGAISWCPWSFGTAVLTNTKFVRMTTGGQVEWCTGTRPDTATALGNSGVNVFSATTLYHVEFKILFHASAGTVEMRVNGAVWMSLSGIDTLPVAANYMTLSHSHANAGTNTNKMSMDNLYFWNDQGSRNNTFLGERTIYTIFPSADTAQEDWTLSSGSDSFALIDNVPPDGATNYLESTVVGDKDTFTLQNAPTSNIKVLGVQVNVQAQKTDAGEGEIQIGVTSNGVEDLSSSQIVTQDQFLYYQHMVELDPDTGLPFEVADINALELTFERSL